MCSSDLGDDAVAYTVARLKKEWNQTMEDTEDRPVIMIFSKDRDMNQFLSPKLPRPTDTLPLVYQTDGINSEPKGAEEVREEFGVPPELLPIYRSLTGDSSDKLAGVRGIPKILAAYLTNKYKDLEEICRVMLNPDKVEDKYVYYSDGEIRNRQNTPPGRVPRSLYDIYTSSGDLISRNWKLMKLSGEVDAVWEDLPGDMEALQQHCENLDAQFLFHSVQAFIQNKEMPIE